MGSERMGGRRKTIYLGLEEMQECVGAPMKKDTGGRGTGNVNWPILTPRPAFMVGHVTCGMYYVAT